MKNFYYPKTTWAVTVALLDVFNDIYIERYIDQDYRNPIGSYDRYQSTSGTEAWLSAHAADIRKVIKVPILYGPVDKPQYTRLEQLQQEGDPLYNYYMTMPRMGMTLTNIAHAPDRAYSQNEERLWIDTDEVRGDDQSMVADFQPVPYDYSFTLQIRSESMEDLSQILENILPYFGPKNIINVKEFSFLNVERDLPVAMLGVNLDFPMEIPEDDMRQVNATIDFNVEGWSYKPPSYSKLVKIIQSQYFIREYGLSADTNTSASDADFVMTGPFDNLHSSFETSGFNATSAIPTTAFDTSGYDPDTDVFWTNTKTIASAGD